MHLIFLHGVPGVGKRTIATQLASELSFPFLDFQNLTHMLGPVFGYNSDAYGELRNRAYKETLDAALMLPEDGIIASFTYDRFIDLNQYGAFIDRARASGGIGLFVGLTCDEEELKDRTSNPGRHSDAASGLAMLEDDFSAEDLETPDLPGPSITINTTGEAPEHTVQNILATLPDDMKGNISF